MKVSRMVDNIYTKVESLDGVNFQNNIRTIGYRSGDKRWITIVSDDPVSIDVGSWSKEQAS